MSWQERLRQEWATAQDAATREYLLAIYREEIATLCEQERERLFAELNDLGCRTAHDSKTHHMREQKD
jgi:hypothetical protein